MKKSQKFIATVFTILVMSPLLYGCVGGQSKNGNAKNAAPTEATRVGGEKLELASLEEMNVGNPLPGKYDNIIIGNFKSSAQVQTDYPKATNDCEEQMVNRLESKNTYKNVTEDNTKTFPGKTAIVDVEIIDMRITSSTARMWGGAFAGSSFMDVRIAIRNAGNKEVIHTRMLATSNSAWGASWNGGSSDRNLPADFGVLIGEYLSRIIPAK